MGEAKATGAAVSGLLGLCLLLLTGCATTPTGDPGHPVMVVAYTTNPQVRRAFENQLEHDLQDLGIVAVPSVELIPDFNLLTHDVIQKAARERGAGMVLMVRRLITDLPADDKSPPSGLDRHRTLAAYFRSVDRTRLPDVPPPGRQVIEVDGYAVRDAVGEPELVWHGFSWVDFDGDLVAAIRETAAIIATNMAAARARIDTGG